MSKWLARLQRLSCPDTTDKRDKTAPTEALDAPFVPFVPFVTGQSDDVEAFIEDCDERAAIMEYDAPDCYATRSEATAAAYEECKVIWLETRREAHGQD
jgi:hypothetical protein